MATDDVLDQFLARYHQARPRVPPAPDEELEALLDLHLGLGEILDGLPLPGLEEEQRQELRGLRCPAAVDLLFECAEGLRAIGEPARHIGLPPGILERTARQDLAVGGVIKGLYVIARQAELGLLLCAGEGDGTCARLTEQAELLARAGGPDGRRLLLALSAPVRARQEALARTPAAGKAQPVEPAQADLDPLAELLQGPRRSPASKPIRGVPPRHAPLPESLEIAPEALEGALDRLALIAARLPRVQVDPATRGALRRRLYPELATVLLRFAGGLRRCGPVAGVDSSPERLDLLGRSLGLYEAIWREAAQGVSDAMDLRLLVGGLGWHLLGTVLSGIDTRLADPGCSRQEHNLFTRCFSKLLLQRERLLLTSEERLREWQADQARLREELAEIERATLVADTMNAVRLGQPVDRQTLERAAVCLNELKEKARRGPGGKK
jgi:hypothetical protein